MAKEDRGGKRKKTKNKAIVENKTSQNETTNDTTNDTMSVSQELQSKFDSGEYKMPSKKSDKKSVKSYMKLIKEHEAKIENAPKTKSYEGLVNHWQKEIRTFKGNILKIVGKK